MPTQVETPVKNVMREAESTSTRLAAFLSAAACPGAGHFVQRRWILGALYITAFVACLVMTLMAVIVPLMANLRISMEFADKGSSEPLRVISSVKVLIWFGLALLIYLAALVDIVVYARRQARRRLDERQKNLETTPKVFSVRCSEEHDR